MTSKMQKDTGDGPQDLKDLLDLSGPKSPPAVKSGQVTGGQLLVLKGGAELVAWKVKRSEVFAINRAVDTQDPDRIVRVKYADILEVRKGDRSTAGLISAAFRAERKAEAEALAAKPVAKRAPRKATTTRGPRVSTKGRAKSAAGYAMPGNGYKGAKNAERNQAIVERLAGGETAEVLAGEFSIKVETVKYIARYAPKAA